MEQINTVNLILHAHLPYVRHINFPRFLEEDWLYESLNETYIPLLRMLEKLAREGVKYHLAICFSPTLCTMLTDEPLQERFLDYMELHKNLGEKEVERTGRECSKAQVMAKTYLDNLNDNLALYESYSHNILTGFKMLETQGYLEILTTAATSAYLPLYENYPQAVKAQVEYGVKTHERIFGRRPRGFWLPECGYYPGLENLLEEYGIRWCQLASHSVITAKNRIESAGYQPLQLGKSSVVGFPRDWSLTSLVWSDTSGYPCDNDYREFYRDIGFDLPIDYIRPYIHEPEVRVFTGYKYWAVTGKTNEKRLYDPAKADEKIKLHIENAIYHAKRKGIMLSALLSQDPVFNLCFDCELFGHRWYEGIKFLEGILRNADKESSLLLSTPSLCLDKRHTLEKADLNACSWMPGGYSDTWLDGSNAWIYRHVHKAIERMDELTRRFPGQTSLKARFLNQAAREIMLAMASDWPYIMHDKTSVTYAEKRLRNHLGAFNLAYANMCKNAVNTEWLINSERRNVIFPDMDYNIFHS